jgi:hypothetical protein
MADPEQDTAMNWDIWFCPNHSCAMWIWLVRRRGEGRGGWLVAPAAAAPAWTIMAPRPMCPRCGTDLITPIDLVSAGAAWGEEREPYERGQRTWHTDRPIGSHWPR